MATTLSPLSWNATTDDLWATPTNEIDSNDGYQFGGLPPGWTWEGFLYVVKLLRMRLAFCYVAVFVNIVVLLLQLKLQSFRKTQFMFGLLLTVSDTTYTVSVLIETHVYLRDERPAEVYYAFGLASNLLGFLSIIGVGLDRYLALCAIPLKYKFLVTTRRYGLIIATLVGLSILYSFVFTRYFVLDSAIVPIRSFIVLTICITVSSLTYIVIAMSLMRSFKKTTLGESVKKARIQQTKRLMFAFSLILISNVICYLPQSIFGLYLSLQPFDQRYGILRNIIISNWVFNIRTLNFTFNPAIYWTQVLMREISWPKCNKKHLKSTGMASGSSTADVSGRSRTTSLSASVDTKDTVNSAFRVV